MNPSNLQKTGQGSTSKTRKPSFIAPNTLMARARGASGTKRVRVEPRSPIGRTQIGNITPDYEIEGNGPPGFEPMEGDVPLPQEVEVMHDTQKSPSKSRKEKKVRGKNICKKVARLKVGEKLPVIFYQNRVVGDNYSSFVRHLGMLVRDSNVCPLRVHSWTEIDEDKRKHMWEAVTEKFDSDDMSDHKEHVLDHMRTLWNNWRGSLSKDMKSKPILDALKDVPERVDKNDWEWLIKEHFLSAKFQEASERNSINRSKSSMPHRTGSKPIREVIYQMGGKNGNPPDTATVFFETRKKDGKLVEPETNEKYDEIQEVVRSEPSLTNIQVVERCFGPQSKGHVVGFGGGVTAKELKGGNSSKAALLEKLNASEKEKESLKRRMDDLENRYEQLENRMNHLPGLQGENEEFADEEFGDREFEV